MHSPPSSTPHSPPFTVTLCSIFGDNRVEMFNQWLLLLLLVQNLCRKVISQSSSKDFLVTEATLTTLDNAKLNDDALRVNKDIKNVLRSKGILVTKGNCSSLVVMIVNISIG
ncbi:Hypothetical predicted protein [Olea europaea subsp. europaea]|uniref:Uncharacterized protein n=1 Tax=Olea europaea subsp. europaea TaxID=158383 RepID=A0A8S0UMK8_OLEEU|nr:Hypothetical predicted protein [Olea europaea subsp. europaea]